MKIAPQILKDLINTFMNCRAVFEVNVPKSTIWLLDVTAFTFDRERSESMYRIQILTENNTKDIFIASENMQEFTVHFG